MMSYSAQQREAPADAEPMTMAEWLAYQGELAAEMPDDPTVDAIEPDEEPF